MRQLSALVLMLVVGLAAPSAPGQTSDPEAAGPRIERALAAAVACVWGAHRDDHWTEDAPTALTRDRGGRTAMAVYALLAAGQSYQSESMARSIQWLCKVQTQSVYVRSVRVMALAQLPAQPGESLVGQTFTDDIAWLLASVRPDGAYDYTPSNRADDAWDNSNTQMAHLAVWAAAQHGATVPAAYWRRAEAHWRRTQTGDGGWSYGSARKPAYGSMTAAGLASLLQCYDELHRDATIRPGADADWEPIDRGLTWMADHFSPWENPRRGPQYYHYYLWAVQRVGAASGYKHLGAHDWFDEIAAELARTQAPDGGWGDLVDTCFALATLARGRAPVLVSKLSYDGLWNPRPRDMANLTRWLSRRFERPVRWQVLGADAPLSQWHDAPVLYISGASLPRFTPEQITRLGSFIARGGLVVSEAAGSSPAFNVQMRKIYAKLFPDRPLRPIAHNHPVYSAHRPLAAPLKLLGISNGVRLLVIHSPTDLSKAWHMRQTDLRADTFQLGANLYVHATDFGEFRRGGETYAQLWPAEPSDDTRYARVIRVARLAHGGNADPEPMAYARMAAVMAQRHRTRVRFEDPIPIAALPPAECPVAVMTGTEAFTLTDADTRALRGFINAGGLLIVDAAGGSEPFAEAARSQILTLVDDPTVKIDRLSPRSPIYQRAGMEIRTVRYRRASRARFGPDNAPRLQVVVVGDRPVIVFSAEDLTAALVGYRGHNLHGYAPASAQAIMRNLLLYAAGRPKPDRPVLQGYVDVQWSPTSAGAEDSE